MRRAIRGLIVGAIACAVLGDVAAAQGGSVRADSARVTRFLDALDAADPLLCEFVADPIGNFWISEGSHGIGRLADAPTELRASKDSLSRRISDAGAIRVLSARLGADDACVRKVAAKMLGNSRVSDDALGRLLDHDSPRVREAALRAVGMRDRPGLRARIERMLGAREEAVVAMAAWALGQLDKPASIPALRRVLTHASPVVRMTAAHALGELEAVAAAGDLERLAGGDGDRRVRLVAIEALGELEQPSSKAVLVRALDADDVELRHAALGALADYDDETLAPRFLRFVTDPDPEVRVTAIEALGELRARDALPAIKRALNDPNADVRRAALEAIAEIEDR